MSTAFVTTAYGGPEHQELIAREAPAPRSGEIAIEVRVAGVNPADAKRREGLFGRSGALPMVLGLEAAGVVTALGEGVEGFAVGDDVLGPPARGLGAFAAHTVLRAADAVHRPAEVACEQAATLPVAGTTAWDLASSAAPGETVLVLGAGGGVGRMAVQVAVAAGARVLGIASARKKGLVESAGAVHVPSGDGASDAARALAPEGADLLLDLVGGRPLRDLAPLVKDPSRILSAADQPTAEELGGAGRPSSRDALARITQLVAEGAVDPHVTARFPLVSAAEAMAAVESGHSGGKIVLIP
ncbi:NADP-dependent oxidoreductase [Brachybacterium saurashtrense]|uniref:NADP-dependent oxidoreductase n=1 Tax=Brachybacterium saurashtrense TaxID=556288 RepID=A0A345YPM0_9MICO|nr:NADP-dependent oxidoreductase [Brachybacterium saurashtrense]AXK45872.1 NADP-dependent oxidoreductase [Brachybacterium saurashtrense]RRR24891.1 NADP-dependent oxidoreductase [Brachybacterium saurashtrense]